MSVSREESERWTAFLRQPVLSKAVSDEELYRAASIGAVTLLYESGNCTALSDAVLRAPAPENRLRALTALANLTKAPDPVRSEAVRQLHSLAILHGHPQAAEILRKNDIRDKDPGWNSAGLLLFGQKHLLLKADPGPEALTALFLAADEPLRLRLLMLGEKILPNWVLLMRFLDDPSDENRKQLLDGYGKFSPDERKLIRFCCGRKDSYVSSLPADLLLRYEDETILDLCVKNSLRPSDPSREALYFFLSGQWEQYYAADSDYRRIRLAYEENDPALQRRLIAVSRESGNSAWLRHIGSSSDRLAGDGTLSGQHLLIRSMIEQKHWDRLWEILPTVPLLCMPDICGALEKAGFRPQQAEEAAFLDELRTRIKACEGTSPIPAAKRFFDGPGTAVGICGCRNRFAVTFADRRILVWDRREADSPPVCISSNRLNFRKAILSHDGKYLCADCGNDGIVIFSLPGGQAVKEIRGDGSGLSGLYLQPDDRRLITVGQNGKGTVISFPGGAELSRFDLGLKDCVRTAYDPGNGRICGISLDGNCTVYDIGGHRPVTGLKLGGRIQAASDIYTQGKLSFIDEDETLSCTNLLSGKRIHDRLGTGPEKTRRMATIGGGDLYILGTADGHIRFFDPTAGAFPAELTAAGRSAVTGIWLDEEGAVLYACTAAGAVRSWDLSLFADMIRVLPMLRLPGLGRINDYCKKYPDPGVKAAAEWLKTVIAWRRRFDIEVEFDE